jgi:hypothetical protein
MSSHALALLQAAFGAQTLVGPDADPPPAKRPKSADVEEIFKSVKIRAITDFVMREINPFTEKGIISNSEILMDEIQRLRDFLDDKVYYFNFFFKHLEFNNKQMGFIISKIEQSKTIEIIGFNLFDLHFFDVIKREGLDDLLFNALEKNTSITELDIYLSERELLIKDLNFVNWARAFQNILMRIIQKLSQRLVSLDIENLIHTLVDFKEREDRFYLEGFPKVLGTWKSIFSGSSKIKHLKIAENNTELATHDNLISILTELLSPFKGEGVYKHLKKIDLSEIKLFRVKILGTLSPYTYPDELGVKSDSMRYKNDGDKIYDIINELTTQNDILEEIIVPYKYVDEYSIIDWGGVNWREWQVRSMKWSDTNLTIGWVTKLEGFMDKVTSIKNKIVELYPPPQNVEQIYKNISEDIFDSEGSELDKILKPSLLSFQLLQKIIKTVHSRVPDYGFGGRLGPFFPLKKDKKVAFELDYDPIVSVHNWSPLGGSSVSDSEESENEED